MYNAETSELVQKGASAPSRPVVYQVSKCSVTAKFELDSYTSMNMPAHSPCMLEKSSYTSD